MRHHVSPNQLALWPYHQLSPAWAPTGIRHPPQTDDGPRSTVTNNCASEGRQTRQTGQAKIKPRPSTGRCTSTSDENRRELMRCVSAGQRRSGTPDPWPSRTRTQKISFWYEPNWPATPLLLGDRDRGAGWEVADLLVDLPGDVQ